MTELRKISTYFEDMAVPENESMNTAERAGKIAEVRKGQLKVEAFLALNSVGVINPLKDYARSLFEEDKSVTAESGYKIPQGSSEPLYYGVLRTEADRVYPHPEVIVREEDLTNTPTVYYSKAAGLQLKIDGFIQVGFLKKIPAPSEPDKKTYNSWEWDFTRDDESLSYTERLKLALRFASKVPDTRQGIDREHLHGVSDRSLTLQTLPLDTSADFPVEHAMMEDK